MMVPNSIRSTEIEMQRIHLFQGLALYSQHKIATRENASLASGNTCFYSSKEEKALFLRLVWKDHKFVQVPEIALP